MQRKPAKRSSLFLLELIIAILFFCLASAVCVRFFVKSHIMEQETTVLNYATDQAVSVAEILRSNQDIPTCLKELFPNITSGQEGEYTVYFDHNWKSCGKSDADYFLSLSYSEEDDLLVGNISVFALDKKDAVYTLEIEKYLQKEVRR